MLAILKLFATKETLTQTNAINGSIDADVVGFSCTSPAYPHALRLAEEMKQNLRLEQFLKLHPSALPQETVAHPYVDQVVIGEGERYSLIL